MAVLISWYAGIYTQYIPNNYVHVVSYIDPPDYS